MPTVWMVGQHAGGGDHQVDTAAGTAGESVAGSSEAGRGGPAHARSGAIHWVVTAAAIGAAVAAVVVTAPAQGAPHRVRTPLAGPAGPSTASHPAVPPSPSAAPDPAKAELPLDCGPFPVEATPSFARDLDGDGRSETVVAAHCGGTNGTPPDGVYVLAAGAEGSPGPRIAATLVRPEENLSVVDLAPGDGGTVVAEVHGYSTPDVPRCCPDVDLILSWARNGDHWVRAHVAAPEAQA